ncbi:MAG TPA: hypothetical protein DEQ84_02935 [Prevotellaceae bacterium]|nr:hypothetical protein [Prevotellaceae bacterium]
MREIDNICRLLDKGENDKAIRLLNIQINTHEADDKLYYMRGNAYFKSGNWQYAMEDYMQAISINAESPAAEAIKMARNILEFYNKEIFCQ